MLVNFDEFRIQRILDQAEEDFYNALEDHYEDMMALRQPQMKFRVEGVNSVACSLFSKN